MHQAEMNENNSSVPNRVSQCGSKPSEPGPSTSTATNGSRSSVSSFLIRRNITQTVLMQRDLNKELLEEINGYLFAPSTNDVTAQFMRFPMIKKIYQKYSCIRTSEAICERMFSYAGKCQKQFVFVLNGGAGWFFILHIQIHLTGFRFQRWLPSGNVLNGNGIFFNFIWKNIEKMTVFVMLCVSLYYI